MKNKYYGSFNLWIIANCRCFIRI